MRNKKKTFSLAAVLVCLLGGGVFFLMGQKKSSVEIVKEVSPHVGNLQRFITSTGSVLPQNRLEIKPPVNGRMEEILVREGEKVKAGQVLAVMSSTERAALLDAARGKGEKELQYWQETYKPISLPAPIDGEIIVAKTQSGQTVTTADAVVVLSDRLIVRAEVDETDIGKIALNTKAVLTLDAYPDTRIRASVGHIYYESQTVNNVTIYEVDLIPENVPLFFRSGMNASVNFIEQSKENVLLIPQEVVVKGNGEDYVLVDREGSKEPVKRKVRLGMTDDKNVEVLSGLNETDRVVVKTKKYSLPKSDTGKNPFMPNRRR